VRKRLPIAPSIIATIGYIAGRYGLFPWMNPEAVSVLLLAAGAVFTLTTATLWALFGKLDAPPPPALSQAGREQMCKKFAERRKILWRRYWFALFISITAIAAGGLLRMKEPPSNVGVIVGVGTSAISLAILYSALAIHEFRMISDALRDLPIELERRKRRQELLSQLPGGPEVP
jgi:hypothetical protein